MPLWRNWQTHWIQNPAGNHMGSSPISGTRIKVELLKVLFFYVYQTSRWDSKRALRQMSGGHLVARGQSLPSVVPKKGVCKRLRLYIFYSVPGLYRIVLALIIKFYKFYLIFFPITCYFYGSAFVCSIYFYSHFV